MRSVKSHVAQYFLKKANENDGVKQNISLKEAQRVLVLLPQDQKQREQAEIWLKKLKTEWKIPKIDSFYFQYRKPEKKEVSVDKREINRTHLNWYLKPRQEQLSGSYQTHYDLLINLEQAHPVPYQFIVAQTQAKMKVGLQSSGYPKGFDLVLKTKKEDSINFIIGQIEKYLNIFVAPKKEANAK